MSVSMAPTVDRPLVGGRYRLVSVLDSTLERTLYGAEDLLRSEPLTVTLLAGGSELRDVAIPFAREADRVSRLRHQSVPALRDWGRYGEDLFLVTDPVEGACLADVLEAGTIDPARTRHVARELASALDHAHSCGVVHGRIRERDVWLHDDGTVTLSGWGTWPVHGALQSPAPEVDNDDLNRLIAAMGRAAPPTTPLSLAELHALNDLAEPQDVEPAVVAHAAVDREPALILSPVAPWHLDADEPRRGDPAPRETRALVVRLALVLFVLVGAGAYLLAPRYSPVPRLAGLPTGSAVAAARAAGFETRTQGVHDDSAPAGVVIRSRPAEGQRASRRGPLVLVVSLGPRVFEVPDVTRASLDDAAAALTSAGFVVGRTSTQFHDSLPEGAVVSQSPSSGALRSGSPIDLVVSRGPAPVPVPRLTGLTLAKAKATLESKALVLGRVSRTHHPTVPAGTVTGHTPASGTVRRGSTIDVAVSDGPDLVKVPDLTGSGRTQAKALLDKAGLQFADTSEHSETVDEGLVIRTDPRPGASSPRGSKVTAVFSLGPRTFAMPSLSGMTRDAAAARLKELGLVLAVEHEVPGSDKDPGTVVGQTPKPGTTVRKGTRVEIYYSA